MIQSKTKNKNGFTRTPRGGFTIVESLVAIGMLLLAVTGAYSVAQQSLQHSQVAREQITAFYLAQEGIEAVKNIRDENFLNSRNWNGGTTGADISQCLASDCLVDPLVERLEPCPNNVCILQQNKSEASAFHGMYSHYDPDNSTKYNLWTNEDADWIPSPYLRTVTVSSTSSNEISVTVKVSWYDKVRQAPENITLREILLNWYPIE